MNRLPALDGIRACAVTLVFLAHAGLDQLVPGGLGVTVFFVMSGYLITGLLRVEHRNHGRLLLARFYERRALRLMPALLIVVVAAGTLAANAHLDGPFTSGGLTAALLYFSNYYLILNDFHGVPAGLGVLWSLAVEEHFYLLFPLWCAWALPAFEQRQRARAGRNSDRNSGGHSSPQRQPSSLWHRVGDPAVVGLLCACVAILAWRCGLYLHGANPRWLQMASDTRADAILAGCILALVLHPQLDERRYRDATRDLGVALLCLAVLAATLLWRSEGFRQAWRYTLQAAALLPLLDLAVRRSHWRAFRWLEARPIVWLGRRSYGFYLMHQVVLFGVAREWPAATGWRLGIFAFLMTLVLAGWLHSLVELPLARWYRRYRPHSGEPVTVSPDLVPTSVSTAAAHRSAARATSNMAHTHPVRQRTSVCIATFRRPEKLSLLLDDLAKQRQLPDEVVVVDNDPAESARAVVEARQGSSTPFDLVYALQPRQNISLTRNRSVELARGDWLAFVDDDERVSPHWLERLLDCAISYRADGVLGPVVPRYPEAAPRWVREGGFHDWARMPTGTVIPANRLRFGNVLLQREFLRHQVRPFDPALGLTGGEDGDLLNRLKLAGARLVWCDEATVDEPVEPSRLRFRWLWLRALRGGQDYARHFLNGRYGAVSKARSLLFFSRALVQMVLAVLLAASTYATGRHRGAHWLFRASANLGKLSVLVGLHYHEYAGVRA